MIFQGSIIGQGPDVLPGPALIIPVVSFGSAVSRPGTRVAGAIAGKVRNCCAVFVTEEVIKGHIDSILIRLSDQDVDFSYIIRTVQTT